MSDQSTGNPGPVPEALIVSNQFVRGRNILISIADFTPLFVDYFFHLKKHALNVPSELSERFRDMLAAFTLHSASRPRNEVLGWTVHFEDPLHNIFLGSDTEFGFVTGRLFTDGVKSGDGNVFYQEQVIQSKPLRRSIVTFEGIQVKETVETYYRQSEQRPAKFFHIGEDRYALVSAHPDFDESWFDSLDLNKFTGIEKKETVNLLETRAYRWFCQCNHDKIMQVLEPLMKENPNNLFGDQEVIQVNCPRCGARYRITRESMDAYVSKA